MTQIYIDGSSIKRKICMEFDVDINLSYDQFMSTNIYDGFHQHIKQDDQLNKDSTGQKSHITDRGWIESNVYDQLSFLSDYDIIESFEGEISDYIPGYDSSKFPSEDRFFDSDFNFQLDVLKHYFTKNYLMKPNMIYSTEEVCHAQIFYSQILARLKYADNHQHYLDTSKKIRRKIKFSQWLIKNYRLPYILFVALLSNQDVYLVIDMHHLDIVLASANRLSKKITHQSNVINITSYIKWFYSDNFLLSVGKIREKYSHVQSASEMDAVITDLLDMINKTWTVLVNLQIQDHVPMYMKWQFKTKDLSKYQDLQEYTSDYWFLAHKNHKWSKNIIVWEKEFKYKSPWNKNQKE